MTTSITKAEAQKLIAEAKESLNARITELVKRINVLEADLQGDEATSAKAREEFGAVQAEVAKLEAEADEPTPAPEPTLTTQLFSPASYVNRDLPSTLTLATGSPAMVKALAEEATKEGKENRGPWINTDEYSVPVYIIDSSTPRRKVVQKQSNGYQDATMNADFASVPVPPDARPAKGEDKHLVLWDQGTDEIWEMWACDEAVTEFQWGAYIKEVSKNPGVCSPSNWGATATSIPLLAGLVTIAEWEAGVIPHALAMAIPFALAGSPPALPALRSDGEAGHPIPEGTIFALPSAVSLTGIKSKPCRALAKAAQTYGIVVRDQSSVITFYGEDPTPTGFSYESVFEAKYPTQFLAEFPWSKLVALKPEG